MEKLISLLSSQSEYVPIYLFAALLLAGLNVPISIDLVLILGAAFALTLSSFSSVILLFFLLLAGCILSAWICYGLGRGFGATMMKWPLSKKLFSESRLEKIHLFYEKRGVLTFFVCRFIPFGVRNCLFLFSGMSKLSFPRFALWDALACTFWCSTSFFIYYAIGEQIELLQGHLKFFKIFLFAACVGTGIALIWYKRKRKKQRDDV